MINLGGGGIGSASGRTLNSERCNSLPERGSSTPLPSTLFITTKFSNYATDSVH